MSPSRYVSVFAALAAFAAPAFAQAQSGATPTPGQAVFRVDAALVNLLCTVREKSGAYVNDLSQSDFTVLEDGRPVPITHFARQTDLPLTVALLLDASWGARRSFDQETEAARQFFHNVLRPGDSALLAGYAAGIGIWQGLTSSQETLSAALDKVGQLAPSVNEKLPKMGPGPVVIMVRCLGGSRLADAVVVVSTQELSNLSGRKAIVALTDGIECGSERSLKEAVQAAQQSDVIVYGIHYDGEGGDGLPTLKELSGPTGGRTFHLDKKTTLDTTFAAIEAEIRNQYAIGYAPPDTARNGTFHKVEVRVAKPGLIVQSRKGYYR